MLLDKQFYHKWIQWALHRRSILNVCLVVTATVMCPLHYWGYAFLYYYLFLFPVVCTIYHDYLAHGYVKPKNKIVEYLSFYVYIFYMFCDLRYKRITHITHHRYNASNPEKDPVHKDLNSISTWRFLLDLRVGKPINKPEGGAKDFLTKMDQGLVSDQTWNFFNKNWLYLIIATHIIWLTFFPLWSWIVFYLYPSFTGLLTGKMSEVWFHKWHKEDNLFFIFFQGSQGWHKSHHMTYTNPKLGATPWDYPDTKLNKNFKYLNGQYYFIKFFFEPSVSH